MSKQNIRVRNALEAFSWSGSSLAAVQTDLKRIYAAKGVIRPYEVHKLVVHSMALIESGLQKYQEGVSWLETLRESIDVPDEGIFDKDLLTVLDIGVRSFHCLTNAGILTIGDLVVKQESDLLKIKNFGVKCLNEIKEELTEHGLRLGMNMDRK